MRPAFSVRRPLRRAAAALGILSVVCLAGAAIEPAVSSADTPGFTNGTAAATATSFRVNPTASQLSLGIIFGQSLSGYTNKVAKSDARGIDLGAIGTTAGSIQCNGDPPSLPYDQQPQPLTADSRDPGSAQGISKPEYVNKQAMPGIEKFVRATDEPYGEADVSYTSLKAPGLFEIAGSHSSAVSHIVNGNTREAIATVDIGSIDLLGGTIKLSNLHWQAIHHSGADSKPTTVFSIGSALISGKQVPTSDPTPIFDAVNKVLGAVGVQLHQPAFNVSSGLVTIDPLEVAVVPNSTRDAVTGNVLNALNPAKQSITNAILEQSCKYGTEITVIDVAIGSISGTGSFTIELGGVSASSGELKLANLLDFGAGGLQSAPEIGTGAGPGLAAAGALPSVGDAGGAASYGGVGGTVGGAKGSTAVAGRQLAAPIAAHSGSRGGMLAAVGLAGLLLLLAAVEGDRRMMRRAQHTIPPEG